MSSASARGSKIDCLQASLLLLADIGRSPRMRKRELPNVHCECASAGDGSRKGRDFVGEKDTGKYLPDRQNGFAHFLPDRKNIKEDCI